MDEGVGAIRPELCLEPIVLQRDLTLTHSLADELGAPDFAGAHDLTVIDEEHADPSSVENLLDLWLVGSRVTAA